jgi:hypothetical protein
MEGIGRVRKVKSKLKDGIEYVVEKSKEKLDRKEAPNGDHDRTHDSNGDVESIENGIDQVKIQGDNGRTVE